MKHLGFLASAQGCKSAERWPISLHKGEGSTLRSYTVANLFSFSFCILVNSFTQMWVIQSQALVCCNFFLFLAKFYVSHLLSWKFSLAQTKGPTNKSSYSYCYWVSSTESTVQIWCVIVLSVVHRWRCFYVVCHCISSTESVVYIVVCCRVHNTNSAVYILPFVGCPHEGDGGPWQRWFIATLLTTITI